MSSFSSSLSPRTSQRQVGVRFLAGNSDRFVLVTGAVGGRRRGRSQDTPKHQPGADRLPKAAAVSKDGTVPFCSLTAAVEISSNSVDGARLEGGADWTHLGSYPLSPTPSLRLAEVTPSPCKAISNPRTPAGGQWHGALCDRVSGHTLAVLWAKRTSLGRHGTTTSGRAGADRTEELAEAPFSCPGA